MFAPWVQSWNKISPDPFLQIWGIHGSMDENIYHVTCDRRRIPKFWGINKELQLDILSDKTDTSSESLSRLGVRLKRTPSFRRQCFMCENLGNTLNAAYFEKRWNASKGIRGHSRRNTNWIANPILPRPSQSQKDGRTTPTWKWSEKVSQQFIKHYITAHGAGKADEERQSTDRPSFLQRLVFTVSQSNRSLSFFQFWYQILPQRRWTCDRLVGSREVWT